ncbi:bifunctional pyr operon transcriptional regulator/uracil phosphoribosyltransferase PyrR [bacterium]|nr:bifunctional pyr operon transcriptional regulator/uracil phosphoribosyltransferase PyrR [bacterium]
MSDQNYKLKTRLLDEADFTRVITRMAHEMIENNKGTQNLALIGVRTRGEFLARRIAERIKSIEGSMLSLGILDVSFYRDDTRAKLKQPQVQSTHIPFDITDKNIILIDDVLYTGRSVRAALDEIMDFGRPAKVELAVLIDRGHRELPIQPDYVGKEVTTAFDEEVKVKMTEQDGLDEVIIVIKG